MGEREGRNDAGETASDEVAFEVKLHVRWRKYRPAAMATPRPDTLLS